MRVLALMLVACGSSKPAPAPPPPSAPPPPAPAAASAGEHEPDQHETIVQAHRKGEEEQQDALAAQCDEPAPKSEHERCLPSCYTTEPADPRAANKKLVGAVEIEHLVCRRADDVLVLADEGSGKLHARPFAKRFPAPHKKGSWQETIETALHEKLPRGDALVVTSGWRTIRQALTHESLRCVMVSHYTRLHRALDACAGLGDATCEATGNAAARAINVVHYRLAEAKRLEAAGKTADCQEAALEAIAVARGLPRWRQYAKLNVGHWKDNVAYRTRFDGTLDEDALFTTTQALGSEAETVYATCGGAAGAPTTPEQEQSFHACW